MEVQIKDHTDKEMLRRITKRLVDQGWKKSGEIQEHINYIPYKITLIKSHPSKVYSQELIKDK